MKFKRSFKPLNWDINIKKKKKKTRLHTGKVFKYIKNLLRQREETGMELTRMEHKMSSCLFSQIRLKIMLNNLTLCIRDHHLAPAQHRS